MLKTSKFLFLQNFRKDRKRERDPALSLPVLRLMNILGLEYDVSSNTQCLHYNVA